MELIGVPNTMPPSERWIATLGSAEDPLSHFMRLIYSFSACPSSALSSSTPKPSNTGADKGSEVFVLTRHIDLLSPEEKDSRPLS